MQLPLHLPTDRQLFEVRLNARGLYNVRRAGGYPYVARLTVVPEGTTMPPVEPGYPLPARGPSLPRLFASYLQGGPPRWAEDGSGFTQTWLLHAAAGEVLEVRLDSALPPGQDPREWLLVGEDGRLLSVAREVAYRLAAGA
jgi:hypothetical protein